MNRALITVSLDVIAGNLFGEDVRINAAMVSTDDLQQGSVTLLIEGEGLPPAPHPGMRYTRVTAEVTSERDEKNLAPVESRRVRFIPV